MANTAKKEKEVRAKDWTFVAYPESLPENWKTLLVEEFDVSKAIISPLHDKDVLDDPDRTAKKPHYHVILRYGSMKSFSQIEEITKALGQPIPQKVKNIEGAVRYLIHADSPDKAQYQKSDIATIGAVDIDKYFTRTNAEEDALHAEIIEFVCDNDITEFAVLMDYARVHNYDWFRFLCRHSYMIDKYITSKRHIKQEAEKKEKTDKMDTVLQAIHILLTERT